MSGGRGSASVELALVLPLVLLVLIAGLELTLLARTRLELVAAAREGARVAATNPDPSRAVQAVREALPEPAASRVRVGVTRPRVVGRPAVVEVSYPHQLVTPLLRGWEVRLSARAVMRVEG